MHPTGHKPRPSRALTAWNTILHYYHNGPARKRQVVLWCTTGERSTIAAAVLQMIGLKNVIGLDGGFGEWDEAQKPVVRKARYV